jgi:hypothetical protein
MTMHQWAEKFEDENYTHIALSVLAHRVETVRPEAISLSKFAKADAVIVDARSDLVGARRFCTAASATDTSIGLVVVISEGGLVALKPGMGCRRDAAARLWTDRNRGEAATADRSAKGQSQPRQHHDHTG